MLALFPSFFQKAPEVKLVTERPSGSFTSGGFPKEAPEVPEGSNLF
jgi:hypothetical protein